MAVGYVRSAGDRLEMDPDRRVREAVTLVFRKFHEIGSVRQVALWFRDERIELPTVAGGSTELLRSRLAGLQMRRQGGYPSPFV